MKRFFFTAVGCIMLFAFVVPLCNAASKSRVISYEDYKMIDSLMVEALSDSISGIILNASKINISILEKDSTGTFIVTATKICNKEQKCVTKFALATSHFAPMEGVVVYGQFNPYLKIQFIQKKQQCTLLYDLGLKQLKVLDAKEEELSTLLIIDNQLIKAVALVYPDDAFINFILNQQ